jgi:hypothetical protein
MFSPSHLAPLTTRPGPGLRTVETGRKSRTETGWYGDIYSNRPAGSGRGKSVVGVCSWRKKMVFLVFPSSMCGTDTSASAFYSNTSSSDLPLLTRHFDSSCLLLSLSSPIILARVLCRLPRHRDYSKDRWHHCASLLCSLPSWRSCLMARETAKAKGFEILLQQASLA